MNTLVVTLVLISCLCISHTYAQFPLSFDVTILQGGTIEDDEFSDVKILNDGSFFVCGTTDGSLYAPTNSSDPDVILVKYRSDLTVVQGIQFSEYGYDDCNAITINEVSNTIYMVSEIGYTPTIHAINGSNLQVKWVRQGTSGDDYMRVAYDTANDRIVVLGVANATASLTVLDTNGVLVWYTTLPPSEENYNDDDISQGLVIDSLGNIYVVGMRLNAVTEEDGWYAKVYPSGALAWYKTVASPYYDEITGVDVNPAGDTLYLAGYTSGRFDASGNSISFEDLAPHGLIMSVSTSTGDLNWIVNQTTYSNQTLFGFFDVRYYSPADLIYVVGIAPWADFPPYNISGFGPFDWLVEIFSSDGQHLQYLNLSGSSGFDTTRSIDVDSQGNFIVVGSTDGNWTTTLLGYGDYVIMKGTSLNDFTNSGGQNSSGDFFSGSGTYIVAGVVGGLVLLAAVVILAVLLVRRKKNKNKVDTSEAGAVAMTTTPTSNTEYVQMGTSTPPQTNYSTVANEYLATPSTQHSSMRPVSSPSKDDWIIQYSSLTVEKKIGTGAFGEVFKGTWRGVDVAIKKMIVEEGVELNLKIQDFFTEAEVMKKIKPHYNITALYGVCVQPLCIITEYVANGSLYNYLISNKQMNDDLKLSIIKGTAAGMYHLHSQGVIHRDLAARNILLDKTLSPKVSDFGMSRVALDNKTNRTANDIGPIKWMAPEAMTDRIYNSKTDIWSFGVVIYEILTRQTPYEGYNLMEVATGIMSGKTSLVPLLKEPQRKYPTVLVDLAEQCLQRDPKQRPDFDQILSRLS